ncbi:MAG: hypothetical protein C4533_05040 [Candidatus Omnitrophota bacterium]|jgi:hypothetical protein|nr:MAG: hypothetical protein C4533_05040 [Candidatus Omnitrophota bacterium]
MKKLIIIIAAIVLIIVIGLVIGRNILARIAIIKGVKSATGMAVDVKGINIGLVGSGISVTGLKIYNPGDFSDRLLADIPEVYVDFDLLGLFKSKVHLRKLKIDITECHIILNEKGKLNVNSLALLLPKSQGEKPPEVKIDELRLKIGKVVYKGYFPAVGAKSKEFNIDIDETFHDVTNPSRVAGDVLKRILNRIGIGGLANFDVKSVGSQMKKEAEEAVGGFLEKAKEDLKSTFSN